MVSLLSNTTTIVYTMYIHLSIRTNSLAPKKSAILNLRIDPVLKEAAREAAMREQRSLGNLIEVLIRRHCDEAGIPIPEQQSMFEDSDDE